MSPRVGSQLARDLDDAADIIELFRAKIIKILPVVANLLAFLENASSLSDVQYLVVPAAAGHSSRTAGAARVFGHLRSLAAVVAMGERWPLGGASLDAVVVGNAHARPVQRRPAVHHSVYIYKL